VAITVNRIKKLTVRAQSKEGGVCEATDVLDVCPYTGRGVHTINMDAIAARFALCGRERSHIGKHSIGSLGGLRDGSLNLRAEEAGNQHGSAARPEEPSKKLLAVHRCSPGCSFDFGIRPRSHRRTTAECGPLDEHGTHLKGSDREVPTHPGASGYAKANAEKLNMGHAGVGSITFTLPLLLNSLLGIKPTMVPFNGAAPAECANRRSSRLHVQRNRRHRRAGSDRDH